MSLNFEDMVDVRPPRNHPASPSSSYVGAASLTINHEATLDLDSTNAFEGWCPSTHTRARALSSIDWLIVLL